MEADERHGRKLEASRDDIELQMGVESPEDRNIEDGDIH